MGLAIQIALGIILVPIIITCFGLVVYMVLWLFSAVLATALEGLWKAIDFIEKVNKRIEKPINEFISYKNLLEYYSNQHKIFTLVGITVLLPLFMMLAFICYDYLNGLFS